VSTMDRALSGYHAVYHLCRLVNLVCWSETGRRSATLCPSMGQHTCWFTKCRFMHTAISVLRSWDFGFSPWGPQAR
jgi:hypothetical protein